MFWEIWLKIQDLIDAKIYGVKSRDDFVHESVKENLLTYQKAAGIKESFKKIANKGG